jgi:predicted transposase/invertase (TIGR01784 family)
MLQDEIWKEIIEKLFEKFVEFFLPDVYPEINFKKSIKFLDKEFNKLIPKTETKNRRADKLVEVTLKNRKKQLLLIHVEVQGYEDKDFAERMFSYYYRIFDKYKRDIDAIAIFTDNNKKFKPDKYERNIFKTKVLYEYRAFKVLEKNEKELLNNQNPFALVILAVKYALESENKKDKEDKHLKFKLELSKLLFKRGYSILESNELFKFINVLLEVKDFMKEELFFEEVKKMARAENKLDIITGYDKVVIKKRDIEIAKKMKKNNEPIEKIMDYTGLSKEEIIKLLKK